MFSLTLLSATIVISLTAWYAKPEWLQSGMLYPYQVWYQKRYSQLISSGFLHADFAHLAFNMITFYFFGPLLEQVVGSSLFLLLYFVGLIGSSIPSLYRHKDNPRYASLGASGAIESVLFAFIILFPTEKIYLFFIPIGIPAVLFGFLFLLYSLFGSKQQLGNVNHDAHIAGAVWGIVFALVAIPNSWERFTHQISNLF